LIVAERFVIYRKGGKSSSTVIPANEPESRCFALFYAFWMPLADHTPGHTYQSLPWTLDQVQGRL
jgi:hypothetical protein